MIRGSAASWAAALLILAPTPGGAEEAMAGANAYQRRCAICHRPNGEGIPGVFPPINNTLGRFLAVPSGRDYLGDVVVFGVAGAITVDGTRYVGQMKLTPPLSDQEAADVLNYVLTQFNAGSLAAGGQAFEAGEIAARRTSPQTPTAVAKKRQDVVAELQALGLSR